MGLRARLALFFVAITVVPLTLAVFVLQSQIRAEGDRAVTSELAARTVAATALLAQAQQRAGDLASALVAGGAGPVLAAGDPAAAATWLDGALAGLPPRADFAVLATGDGRVLAAALSPAEGVEDASLPDGAAIAAAALAGRDLPGAVLESRSVQTTGDGRVLGVVVSGLWLDAALLEDLALGHPAAFVRDGAVVAVTGADAARVRAAELPPVGTSARVPGLDAQVAMVGVGEASGMALWTSAVAGGPPWGLMATLLIPAVLAAALLGWFLAGQLVRPIRDAAEAARAVAAGDLSQTITPRGPREVQDMARALNTMGAQLRLRMEELQHSRDELRRSLSRLGQTLSSSLDINRTLAVMVETAMDTLGVPKALLMLVTPEQDGLYVKVSRGVGQRVPVLGLGEGLAGFVAQTGRPVRLPDDQEAAPAPAPGEPTAVYQLAVPLLGRGRVIGVLSLLREPPAVPFSQDDLDTIRSFAAQASVAIENVLLHQEAQRLSLTDPLTGLWNFRYFQMQTDRELEGSGRSNRPLSVIIVDLDHFKKVNDTFGHPVGDEVLVEVARRLRDSTRVPDVVARYGGEEFVVLLPGADRKGAITTAERIRAAVGERPVVPTVADIGPLEVTCSVGVATSPRHGRTVAGLLRAADAAMYTAKKRGRNRVVAAGRGGVVPLPGERSSGGAGGR